MFRYLASPGFALLCVAMIVARLSGVASAQSDGNATVLRPTQAPQTTASAPIPTAIPTPLPINDGKTSTKPLTLMEAAKEGRIEDVRALVTLRDDESWVCTDGSSNLQTCLDKTDKSGYTALMYASERGNIEIVNYLINAGADIDKTENSAHFTALQLAQNAGKDAVASVLARKLDSEKSWEAQAENYSVTISLLTSAFALFIFIIRSGKDARRLQKSQQKYGGTST